ncbi:MAG: cell division protein SepF [Firmicutes bacterium]|jgi:cell division inhibitor SepF|nr:cell division protein SepF [Bacillota bacterium]
MASVFDKVLTLLGVREEIEDDPEVREERQLEVLPNQRETKQVRRSNLISLDGGAKPIRIIIIEPTEFEEVRTYVDHLKNKHPLIVRLNHMDIHEARRIVDFMSGATYAIDGNMQKLGDMIFFFAPQSVTIEGEIETDLFDLGILGE